MPASPVDLTGRQAAVITLSDRAYRGTYPDTSGPAIKAALEKLGAQCKDIVLLPDEPDELKQAVETLLSASTPVDLIITTGGTGVAARDRTPETLAALFDREIPGIGELLRNEGAHFTPLSWASRSIGGLVGNTIVLCLPGSLGAVKESMQSLKTLLPHLVKIAQGS